jgi:uncharacterized repeat protein (TIGR01451 family)
VSGGDRANSGQGAFAPGGHLTTGLPRRRFFAVVAAVATMFLSVVGTMAAPAATTLALGTPYPAVSVAPGSKASFDLTITTDARARVDLAVSGAPAGWTATMTGGGYVVNAVLVDPKTPPTVRLDVKVPASVEAKSYRLTVTATSGALHDELPIDITVNASTAGDVTLTTDFPSLQGPSSTPFTFNLSLKNDTAQDLTFGLNAQGPTGWTVTAKPSSQSQAATFQVNAASAAGITVSAEPPRGVAAGAYPITVTATAGDRHVGGQLEVQITGDFAMNLTTPDARLNASGPAGGVITRTLAVQNTGTAALTNVTMSETLPTGWKVTYDPVAPIASIAGGASSTVTATITPASNAIAGDYVATFRATAGGSSTEASTDIRVTIETPLNWLIVGGAVIVLVLIGLGWVFSHYGRR